MRILFPLFLLIGIWAFSYPDSKTNELKSQIDQPEIARNQNGFSIEFPEIDFPRLLTLNSKELRITRNSIFAKYGRTFKSDDLKNYFESQTWYEESDGFSLDLLTESDKTVIELITHLEKNENILWKSIINIDGKGDDELCLLVEKNDHSGAMIYINDEKIELRNNWIKETETFYGESLSSKWSSLKVKIIDINKIDNCKEVVVTQKYFDWEDPGYENIIVTKHDGFVKSYTLGSNSYNSGELTLSENKIILNVSNCPAHTQTYSAIKGVINMVSEIIGEVPKHGCAACFVGNSMVEIEGGLRKAISKLRVGDTVISYDTKTGIKTETIIEEMISVHHSYLIELIFDHDTITSTKDHPYYVNGKGWCSFNTAATEANYSNYNSVNTIELGDDFIRSSGSISQLLEIHPLYKPQITYTISKLMSGDSFYLNDILVGIEEIRNPV
jgi:hypothetical protein